MKNFLLIALFCAGQIIMATAQTNPSNPSTNSSSKDTTFVNSSKMSDYERMLQNQQKVDFRTQSSKTLGLSAQQVKDFDPLYNSYMKEKSELAQDRMKLLNKYMKEIAEDDSPANEENDKEEFLEDYIELQIKEMKLRKEYFDKMEDVITADKAFGFYLIEDMAANSIYNQILDTRFAPFTSQQWNSSSNASPSNNSNSSPSNMNNRPTTIPPNSSSTSPTNSGTNPANSTINLDATNDKMNNANPAGTTGNSLDRRYRADIDAYSNWSKNTKMVIDNKHQYTHDGLNKLVTAISSLSTACSMANDNAFTSNKHKIMANATELQKDPSSTTHARLMRESFIMAADMLKKVQQSCGQNSSTSSNAITQMADAARKLDVSKATSTQQQYIKDFFQKSQTAIDGMANGMNWSSGSK